jgi:transcriptional repressor NrdR
VHCPFCKAEDTRVVDSRVAEDGALVRRRRECEKCNARFTTFEKAQLSMPQILKRNGTPEPYDEAKLQKGLERALYKRPVGPEQIDGLIEVLERKLRTSGERQVPSRQLGDWVMEELRDTDEVAYVRFASIYHEFKDVTDFSEHLERLKATPSAEERRSQMPLIGEPPDTDKKKD